MGTSGFRFLEVGGAADVPAFADVDDADFANAFPLPLANAFPLPFDNAPPLPFANAFPLPFANAFPLPFSNGLFLPFLCLLPNLPILSTGLEATPSSWRLLRKDWLASVTAFPYFSRSNLFMAISGNEGRWALSKAVSVLMSVTLNAA